MSRGGRGGGRGGKRGPDLSWQDDDPSEPQAPVRNVPGPLFPKRELLTPKPLSNTEKASVSSLLSLRERIHAGPLYTVLEPSSLVDNNGKANPRVGFDPFNDQEKFTRRYHRKRRVVPDLASGREGYTLRLFPVELWPVLDPKRQQKEYWDNLSEEVKARISSGGGNGGPARGTKRKRTDKLRFDDDQEISAVVKGFGSEDDDNNSNKSDDEDEDGILDGSSTNRRRRRTANRTRRNNESKAKQKKGLDAEDDYPDADQQNQQADEDGEGGGTGTKGETGAAGEDEPQDSEFSTDEDEAAMDDYNGENYFDDGAESDPGDGDDDGGGGGGDYY